MTAFQSVHDSEWQTGHPTDPVWGFFDLRPPSASARRGRCGWLTTCPATAPMRSRCVSGPQEGAEKATRLIPSYPVRTKSRLIRWTRGLGTCRSKTLEFFFFLPCPSHDVRGDHHAEHGAWTGNPSCSRGRQRARLDIRHPHHDEGSLPHRDDGGGGGPGLFLHHHHVSLGLGARFPSPVCVRLGQAETTVPQQPGQQPSQSTGPNLKSHD